MNNIQYIRSKKSNVEITAALKLSYQHATKTLIVLDSNAQLNFMTYRPDTMTIQTRATTSTITQLKGQNVVLMEFMVDAQAVLIATENGAILMVDEKGNVDIKAQNDDGIAGGSVSPTQEYIYIVTKNNTLIQLDPEFDPIKQIPVDDHQTQIPDPFQPTFSWKPDGSFFCLNIQTDKGRKCHTRDNMLGIFRSPSKSDIESQGLVQSVSEKSRVNMGSYVAWQPNGGIIAGTDVINKAGKKVNRVIFWEKNGLRHLEFQLPDWVTDVLNLNWSPDSQILYVQTLNKLSQRNLCLYHRSNYHWHLKSCLRLQSESTLYLLLKQKHNQVLIMNDQKIDIYEYVLGSTKNSWKTQQQQRQSPCVLQVSVDGNILKITDFSQGIIPPPMCHCKAEFQDNLNGVALWGKYVLVVEGRRLWLCQWDGKQLENRRRIDPCQELTQLLNVPINFRIIRSNPNIQFTYNNSTFEIDPQNLKAALLKAESQNPLYKILLPQPLTFTSSLQEQSLQINGTLYTDHCTSYTFYHEFLIFTVASSSMYDKMFIFDLQLDQINSGGKEQKQRGKIRMQEAEVKKGLNYRAIQRGAKIVGCAGNRVIFELPRGNLEAIYPKVLTIKSVKKSLNKSHYKQAFQSIRTHKLDFNLLFDINPVHFTQNCKQILLNIDRTDYLNLFVSQLKDQISSQLVYCIPQSSIDQNQTFISINIQGKKIKYVCQLVSKNLRYVDTDKYILSIFTSEIKMGLVEKVLFQIMERKKGDVEQILPPHLGAGQIKKKKVFNSQEVLEYVCWLVDANAIYEASLLTYDLQLASMTARCTQMDPKQYIPYLQQLKQIQDPIQLRHKICLDLKNFSKAVEQLSKGNETQVRTSIEYIKKHKLYKCGLKTYNNRPEYLKEVKMLVIEELYENGENNQAYKMSLSIGAYERALDIAKKMLDGSKIKEVLECDVGKTREEKQEIIKKIINNIGQDGFKNKGDLAELKLYLNLYNEATTLFIRSGNYIQAFKSYIKTTQQYKQSKELENGLLLLHSLQKNQLLKEKAQFLEKSARLQKVHRLRAVQGPTLNVRNLDNDDMYSEVSVSSKAVSQYTVSTTTGLRKKRDKKKSILSRNVKEGSPLEEEYLVAFLFDLLSKVEPNIKQTKQLIQHLIYLNLVSQAESLRNTCREYGEVASKCIPKYYAQTKFEADHPEYLELLQVYQNKGVIEKDKGKERRDRFSIDSFNYLF